MTDHPFDVRKERRHENERGEDEDDHFPELKQRPERKQHQASKQEAAIRNLNPEHYDPRRRAMRL